MQNTDRHTLSGPSCDMRYTRIAAIGRSPTGWTPHVPKRNAGPLAATMSEPTARFGACAREAPHSAVWQVHTPLPEPRRFVRASVSEITASSTRETCAVIERVCLRSATCCTTVSRVLLAGGRA